MNQYQERKANEAKVVNKGNVNDITFDHEQQNYIITLDDNPNGIERISIPELKSSKFTTHEKIGNPYGVGVQPGTGNVAICDLYGDEVKFFSNDGELSHTIPLIDEECICTSPDSIAFNADGRFAVSEVLSKRMKLFDASGRRVFTSSPQSGHLKGICYLNRRFAPSASATLLITCNHSSRQVLILSIDDCNIIHTINHVRYPVGVCVDLNGYICVSSSEYISLVPQGPIHIFEPRMNYALLQNVSCLQTFNRVGGLCVSSTNELVVSDLTTPRLRFFD